MTDRLHLKSVRRVPAVPRRLAMAGAGLVLVALYGLCAVWGRPVLDSGAMWPAVVATATVLLAATVLFGRVRRHAVSRLRLEGTMLRGRTLLGEHGVDLAERTAVSVSWDDDVRTIAGLALADDEEQLLASWAGLEALPEAGRCAACSWNANSVARWCCRGCCATPGTSPRCPERR